jgi:hypothetical protein
MRPPRKPVVPTATCVADQTAAMTMFVLAEAAEVAIAKAADQALTAHAETTHDCAETVTAHAEAFTFNPVGVGVG